MRRCHVGLAVLLLAPATLAAQGPPPSYSGYVAPIGVASAPVYCSTAATPWCISFRAVDLGLVAFSSGPGSDARAYALAVRNLGTTTAQALTSVGVTRPAGTTGTYFWGKGGAFVGSVWTDWFEPAGSEPFDWVDPGWDYATADSFTFGFFGGISTTRFYGCGVPPTTAVSVFALAAATCPTLGYDGELVMTLRVSRVGPSGTRLGDDLLPGMLADARISVGPCTFVGGTVQGCVATGAVVTPAALTAPEPATLTLLGAGLLAVAGISTRRRRDHVSRPSPNGHP